MTAILKRELRAYFLTMTGYIFLALFLILGGLMFTMYNLAHEYTTVKAVLGLLTSWEAFILPILTMRMFSEDRRLKTDRLLYTAPVTEPGIVFGKYFAAFIIVAAAVAVLFIYTAVLAAFGTVNWAETISSFIGFLLLCGVFLAIGAFMSALTDSMVVAAFSTYAVLVVTVFLGNIADITDGAVRDALLWLSPSSRFDDFGRGVLDVSALVYYISLIAIFISLTVTALKRGGKRLVTAAEIAVMVAVFTLLNVFMTLLVQRTGMKLDLTANKLYELSDKTYDYLKSYDKDTSIYILADTASQDMDVRLVLDRYAAANEHIKIENIDIRTNPAFGLDYAAKGENIDNNDLVIVSGDRSKIIDGDALIGGIADDDVGIDVESEVTSALMSLESDGTHHAYFTTGHKESKFPAAEDALGEAGYEVSELDIENEEVPADADVIIIAHPMSDLSDKAIKKIDDHIRSGGALEVYVDTECTDIDELSAYLEKNGIKIGKGGIIESSDHVTGEAPNVLFVADFESNDVTDRIIAKNKPVLYPVYASPLEIKDVGKATDINAFLKSSDISGVTVDFKSAESVGSSNIALRSINYNTDGQIYVSGTTMLLTRGLDELNGAGLINAEYFTAVTDAVADVNEVFSVPVKVMSPDKMKMSVGARRIFAIVILGVLPLGILGIGFLVYIRRRHM
ncbi:MAG: Gldg family protein [Clostridia bacterium]|nr:Gldg family protein [Clostridia bacterium]